MRLSCGDHSFQGVPQELALDLVARLGFDGVDLMLREGITEVRPERLGEDPGRWAGRVEERVASRGLEVVDVFHGQGAAFEPSAPNAPDAEHLAAGRAQFRDVLDFAARVGAPGMTVLPGIDWPHEDHAASLARAGEELARRVEEAGERGLRLSVEPHVGSVCRTPEDVAELCERAPGLGLTFDYTHYVCQGHDEAELEPLLRHARHVHARGGADGRLQTRFDESTIDFPRMLDALDEIGYEGFVAVEYCCDPWARLNELDVLSETVIMRDHLRAARTRGALVGSTG